MAGISLHLPLLRFLSLHSPRIRAVDWRNRADWHVLLEMVRAYLCATDRNRGQAPKTSAHVACKVVSTRQPKVETLRAFLLIKILLE